MRETYCFESAMADKSKGKLTRGKREGAVGMLANNA
jgi:hypothetical protein